MGEVASFFLGFAAGCFFTMAVALYFLLDDVQDEVDKRRDGPA